MRYGLDLQFAYDSEYWGAYAGGALVYARFVEGMYDNRDIPLVPGFTGFAGLYVKPLEWLTISGQVNYSSNQYQGNDYANAQRRMPSYVTADFRVNFRFCEYASMYAAVENAFNETYAAIAYGGVYYPCMGRMFKIGLNFKF